MKMFSVVFIGLLLFCCGCEERTTVLQSDEEFYSYMIGNVELIFNFTSIFGKELTMNNANDRAVGVYIVDNNDSSLIIFSDSWTWGGNSEVESDVNFNHNQELKVIVVIYTDVSSFIANFIQALGPDFLEEIQDIWVQARYEEIVVLQ